ncbi:hypothetical protein [Thermoactinomyces mirandus]|uniref:Uncharacterized protein n=1 Tax=Thermoactinomyces mirandus TaxID=2756294 RepID=A0A7W1XRA3_9BACL|nr:hypothetical protein [Thermoactinomyces mirandus]MBA4601848.1 hypothetical protein [Thermoactinomyces mirandus]
MPIPKTSAYRMTGSLTEMGFPTRDEEGKYSLGLLFPHFGQLVAGISIVGPESRFQKDGCRY